MAFRSASVAVRREDAPHERRSPLAPAHVALLVARGIEVVFQRCERRVFGAPELEAAGARVVDDLAPYPLVLGIKEIAARALEPTKTYLFFSHTVKGQPQNLPLLRRLIELGSTLIDYERVTDDAGRRTLVFGRFAGVAGMADTLWALGRRLAEQGIDTPLTRLGPAHRYADAETLFAALERVGRMLRESVLPPLLAPLVIGVAGSGNTSGGAREVLRKLGAKPISPAELPRLAPADQGVYSVVFEVQDLVEAPDGHFDRSEYFQYPHRYRSAFARHLPFLNVLVNCIYWEPRYPRLVRLADLRQLYAAPEPRLQVIGDISCDLRGAIEATVRATWPDDPVYLYDVANGCTAPRFAGPGPAIMAVYNLPAELPRDASIAFGDALWPLAAACARADFRQPFEDLALPEPLRRAVILHAGQLVPAYAYLATYL